MKEWIRPYHDPVRVVTGGLAMFGSAFFAFAAVTMVAQWRETTVLEAGVLVGSAAVWLTFLSSVEPGQWDEVIAAYGGADGLNVALRAILVQGLLTMSDSPDESTEAMARAERLEEAARRISLTT